MHLTCATLATQLFFQDKTLVIKFSNAIDLCDFCHLAVFQAKTLVNKFSKQFTSATPATYLFFFLKRKPCFLKIQLQLTCATLAT